MELRRAGHTLEEIALRLGTSKQLVFYDVTKSLEKLNGKHLADADWHLRKSLANLDMVRQQAIEAWLRSKEDREQVVEELKTGGKDEGEKLKTLREGQAGDPRFLQVMIDVEDKRNKLLGLDKTTTVNQTNVQVNVLVIPEALAKATNDELLRIVNSEAGVIDVGETSGGGDAHTA